MSTLKLSEEPDATDDDRAVVVEGLRNFNHQYMTPADAVPLTLILRDESNQIRGGLLGATRWHWLLVESLWVSEEHRGRGYGRVLSEKAEAIAEERGCLHAALDTTEFQAKEFYEKCGYSVFGKLADYPPGSQTYFMRKSFGVA